MTLERAQMIITLDRPPQKKCASFLCSVRPFSLEKSDQTRSQNSCIEEGENTETITEQLAQKVPPPKALPFDGQVGGKASSGSVPYFVPEEEL